MDAFDFFNFDLIHTALNVNALTMHCQTQSMVNCSRNADLCYFLVVNSEETIPYSFKI
jgi:hypothetical protein